MPEPLERGAKLRVVHRQLPVGDKGALERSERGREFGEASGMVEAVSAYQPDGPGDFVRQHPPAVHLLLVDPLGAMERARDERGVLDAGQPRRGHRVQDSLSSRLTISRSASMSNGLPTTVTGTVLRNSSYGPASA